MRHFHIPHFRRIPQASQGSSSSRPAPRPKAHQILKKWGAHHRNLSTCVYPRVHLGLPWR